MPASPLAPACLTAPQLCPPISRPPTSPPLQCRLQTGTTDRYHMYAGPLDCLRQTVRAEGLRGLMRGLGGTMAREMPGNAVCEPCLGWDCCLLPMAAGLLAVCFCRMSLASVHAQRLSTLPPSPPTTTTPPPLLQMQTLAPTACCATGCPGSRPRPNAASRPAFRCGSTWPTPPLPLYAAGWQVGAPAAAAASCQPDACIHSTALHQRRYVPQMRRPGSWHKHARTHARAPAQPTHRLPLLSLSDAD